MFQIGSDDGIDLDVLLWLDDAGRPNDQPKLHTIPCRLNQFVGHALIGESIAFHRDLGFLPFLGAFALTFNRIQ